jgi:catechol 2,3-dioxygenase-like lactoylglutathione lyase family enzyme
MRAFTSRRRGLVAALSVLAGLLLAVPATAAACGETAPPDIKWAKVSPATLPWEGGTIVLTTEVESDCGAEVYAEVNTSGPLQWSFQMLPTDDPNSNVHFYRSEIGAPANYKEEPFYYEFAIRALDQMEGSAETFAGGTEVAAAPNFDEAPYVSNAVVTPTSLGTEGGWVTISADVSDNRSVNYVFANIMLPDETLKEVPLEPVSSSHFVGHYKAPANYGTTATKYPVTVYGEDDIGQQRSESAGTFKVAGRPGPLSVEIERSGSIGNVTVGRTATRLVTVHNSGGKWFKASLTVAGSPWFALRNASGGKIEFGVGPGESRRFWLEFTPATLGSATGSLTLARADGAQPPIVKSLSGKGIPPAS